MTLLLEMTQNMAEKYVDYHIEEGPISTHLMLLHLNVPYFT